ncbi:MAG: hypothetical protein ACKVS5_14270 [Parvularculaceae bacterium]
MTRAFGILLLFIGAAPAAAETIVLRPDPCPAGAELPLIIDLGDVETFTNDPAGTIGQVLVIYPPVGDGWASSRILMRFDFDARPQDISSAACRAPKLFRMPR